MVQLKLNGLWSERSIQFDIYFLESVLASSYLPAGLDRDLLELGAEMTLGGGVHDVGWWMLNHFDSIHFRVCAR